MMDTFLSLASYALLGLGAIMAMVCAMGLRREAFREGGVFWGVACLLIPMATMVFILRFRKETKTLFYTQLVGIAMMAAGFGIMLLDPAYREDVMMAISHRAERASPGPRPETAPVKMAADQKYVQALLEEKERTTRDLYALVQAWTTELQQKSPGPGASSSDVLAFNEEYEEYKGLLGEYKAAVVALKRQRDMARVAPLTSQQPRPGAAP